jgi:ligand-binding SRPBCC domain-containing protein
MPRFERRSLIAAPAARVFAFHELPDALERLTPPTEKVVVLEPPSSLAVGTRVVLRTKIGPFSQRIVAVHREYEPGRMFADEMVEGPFAHWYHRHIVEPESDDSAWLIDQVEYTLPLGVLGALLGRSFAQHKLQRLFDFRHSVTSAWCLQLRSAA